MEIVDTTYNNDIYDIAIIAYKLVLSIAPGNLECWKALSTIYYDFKKYHHTRRCTRKVISLTSDSTLLSQGYNFLGVVYLDQARHDKALECLDKSLEYNPENYTAWSNKASLYRELNNPEKAAYCQLHADEIKKSLPQQLEEEEDGEPELEYILPIFPPRDNFSLLLGMYDNDAKVALSSWADDMEFTVEKIRSLIGLFKGSELNISYTDNTIVCVAGDEELLELAVEQEILHNDNYLLKSEYQEKLKEIESNVTNDEYDTYR